MSNLGISKTIDQSELDAFQLDLLKCHFGDQCQFDSLSDLAKLPVHRKADLVGSQKADPPFGVLGKGKYPHIFQSPGPIYEPGRAGRDPWRFGRFLGAIGIDDTDLVLNTFAYHFTPAGMMLDTAAQSLGAIVFPAGPGNTMAQVEVASSLGATAYVGTPDFLSIILERGDKEGIDLSSFKFAAVSGGPLFPSLRDAYSERGILCRQCYGTAELGLVAYETADFTDAMLIDRNILVEIVSPGSDELLNDGDIGEVVVTALDEQCPIARFSTGDLSAIVHKEDYGRCLVGWRGRADQAAKVKGMFIRPEQVSALVKRHPDIHKARVEISRDNHADLIEMKIETHLTASELQNLVQESLKLRATVTCVAPDTLPKDGLLVSDRRLQSE